MPSVAPLSQLGTWIKELRNLDPDYNQIELISCAHGACLIQPYTMKANFHQWSPMSNMHNHFLKDLTQKNMFEHKMQKEYKDL